MKEIKLTEKDWHNIKDYAHYHYISKSSYNREENFVTICIVQSFLDYCKKNCYNIKDGKIFKNDM